MPISEKKQNFKELTKNTSAPEKKPLQHSVGSFLYPTNARTPIVPNFPQECPYGTIQHHPTTVSNTKFRGPEKM